MELDRATFRRLVQLHLVLLPAFLIVAAFEVTNSRWAAFSGRFDQLVVDSFGTALLDRLDGIAAGIAAGVVAAAMAWAVAAAIGLLWFRRWARFGFWASVALLYVLWFAVNGNRPSYTTAVTDALVAIDGALFGAILLLAYARGLGQDWFAAPTDITED